MTNRDPDGRSRDSVAWCRSRFFAHGDIADQVAKILRRMRGLLFKDLANFGYALARHAFVATDNEDEFFGLPVHGEIEVFVADPPKRD